MVLQSPTAASQPNLSAGYRSREIGNWVSASNQFWTVGPGLALNLLDFGQRSANRAQALALRDLADEPLANLDLSHAAGLVARLADQARGGAGVVLVLHDLEVNGRVRQVSVDRDGAQFVVRLDDRTWRIDAATVGAHTLSMLMADGDEMPVIWVNEDEGA